MRRRERRLHFVAEAQATRQLEHPGIPPVHDLGLTPDGRLYFTMKLVRGRTLREVLHDLFLKRREVPARVHAPPARDRARAHRGDAALRPRARRHPPRPEARERDARRLRRGPRDGLGPRARARRTTSERTDRVRDTARTRAGLETQDGVLKGTLPYMSPEQARGERTLDRRSDVYALGCLLYEVLTLQAPFEPDGPGADPDEGRERRTCPTSRRANPRRPVPEALARRLPQGDGDARPRRATRPRGEMGTGAPGVARRPRERERRHEEAEALAARGERRPRSGSEAARKAAKKAEAAARGRGDRSTSRGSPWRRSARCSRRGRRRRALRTRGRARLRGGDAPPDAALIAGGRQRDRARGARRGSGRTGSRTRRRAATRPRPPTRSR